MKTEKDFCVSFFTDNGRNFFLNPTSLRAWMEIKPQDFRDLPEELFVSASEANCYGSVSVDDELFKVIDIDFFITYYEGNKNITEHIEYIKSKMITELEPEYFN